MHEEVAHGELAGDVGVIHRESREVPDHRIVPAELSLLDEQCDRRGGEQLRVRRDAKPRVGVDAVGAAQLPDAVTFGEHDAAVLHDRHRGTGHVERLQDLLDIRIEAGGRLGRALRVERRGVGEGNRDEQQGGAQGHQVVSARGGRAGEAGGIRVTPQAHSTAACGDRRFRHD